jgi:hypothetical protein
MQEPHSISLYPGSGSLDGTSGDHILLAPAYTSTEDDIRTIVATTTRVIKRFFCAYNMETKNKDMLVSSEANDGHQLHCVDQ